MHFVGVTLHDILQKAFCNWNHVCFENVGLSEYFDVNQLQDVQITGQALQWWPQGDPSWSDDALLETKNPTLKEIS